MILEQLENLGYKNNQEINSYLLGMEEGLEALKQRKNIWLFGAGENGFLALKILADQGIDIEGVVDNNRQLVGKHCGDKIIEYAGDRIKNKDIYIIISVDGRNIGGVRLQLLAEKIDSYSIFFRETCHSFYYENRSIYEAIMEGINLICFYKEDIKKSIASKWIFAWEGPK